MTISDVLRAIKKHWIVEIVLFCVVVGVVAGDDIRRHTYLYSKH